MPYSKYYNALGLPNNASQEEIRKKFRKLVMLYHPDKNPDPYANIKFLEITEAYTILLNKVDVPIIEKSTSTRKREPVNSTSARAEKIKEAQRRFQEQKNRTERENELYYQNLTQGKKWKIFKVTAFIALAFALLLVIDPFLPSRFEKDEVIAYNSNDVIKTSGDKILIETKNNHTFFLNTGDWNYHCLYTNGTTIYIEESFILHMAKTVFSQNKSGYKSFEIEYSLRQLTPLFIILFSIPFLTFIFKRKSTIFVILFRFSLYFVNALIIYLLLTESRIIHLFTLGYF